MFNPRFLIAQYLGYSPAALMKNFPRSSYRKMEVAPCCFEVSMSRQQRSRREPGTTALLPAVVKHSSTPPPSRTDSAPDTVCDRQSSGGSTHLCGRSAAGSDKPRHNLLYASASLSRLGMTGVIPRLAAPVFYPTLGPCTTSCSVLCLRRGSHAEQNSGGLAHR